MSDTPATPSLSRRDVLATAAGALVISFWMPQRALGQIIAPEGAAGRLIPCRQR